MKARMSLGRKCAAKLNGVAAIVIVLVFIASGIRGEGSSEDVELQSDHIIARAAIAVPEPECVKNETHCSCVEKPFRSLVAIENQPGRCELSVEHVGAACACPGTSICEFETRACGAGKLKATSSFDEAGTCECEQAGGGLCGQALNPTHCTAAVKVFVDGQYGGCVNTIPVTSDVDDAYGYANARANNIQNVEYDRINLRFIETRENMELHFCVIYGNWKIGQAVFPDDPVLSRKEKAEITANFPLFFEIKDDPSDFYDGDGTDTVRTSHAHFAYKSDGFCLGPLLGDGSGIRAKFYDLDNILGLNVQSFNQDTYSTDNLIEWNFGDNRLMTDLHTDGRANGDESVIVDFQPACECPAVR